jgi:hypothetical protein
MISVKLSALDISVISRSEHLLDELFKAFVLYIHALGILNWQKMYNCL